MKDKFVELCKEIEYNGKYFIDYIDLEYNENKLLEDKDFPILKEKMNNLICLLNRDDSILDLDIEKEIWNLI
jgi:hypothetical protein